TPVITSSASVTGIVGSTFTYTITATNNPTSFDATGLPPGLSISSGVIAGVPSAAGVFGSTVSATNASGTGAALVTFTISASTPVITSSASVTGIIGSTLTYTVTATNNPTSFAA